MATTITSLCFLLLLRITCIYADDYAVDPNNKSLLIAAGCFWCAEQAFEQYAPGVIEAVSGYSGPDGIDNPTYRNHPGHYEVILIEYDPLKTTYKLLVEYAWRNIDPFNGGGQFCDSGPSYYPAIFYDTDDEKTAAEEVKAEILQQYPDWEADNIVVPLLKRPKFWTAEEYHQDYYIKNPKNYGYYKNACGRTKRLKQVWGEDEYYCYHDYGLENYNMCFGDEENVDNESMQVATVLNEDGEKVKAEINIKEAEEEVVGLMPTWAVTFLSILGAFFVCTPILLFAKQKWKNGNQSCSFCPRRKGVDCSDNEVMHDKEETDTQKFEEEHP